MANEIQASFRVWDSVNDVGMILASLGIDVSGRRYVEHTQLIGTTEEALALGELATLGIFAGHNTDPTNYLEVRSGAGASNDYWKFLPGEKFFWRWGSDITAPYAIANTSACYFRYIMWEQ